MGNSSAFRGPGYFSCMAIVLVGALFGSCSSEKLSSGDVITQGFAELRLTATSVIGDSVRQQKLLQASQQLEVELRSFDEYTHGAIMEFQDAFRDYDVNKDSLAQLSATYRERQQQAYAGFIDAHVAMAASVTADEWKPLSKLEIKLLENLRDAAAGGAR